MGHNTLHAAFRMNYSAFCALLHYSFTANLFCLHFQTKNYSFFNDFCLLSWYFIYFSSPWSGSSSVYSNLQSVSRHSFSYRRDIFSLFGIKFIAGAAIFSAFQSSSETSKRGFYLSLYFRYIFCNRYHLLRAGSGRSFNSIGTSGIVYLGRHLYPCLCIRNGFAFVYYCFIFG